MNDHIKYLALSVNGTTITLPSGIKGGGLTDMQTIIQFIIQFLLITAIVLTLAYLIYGGFNYMTSGGDKAKVEAARTHIIHAAIGLALAFLAFAILNIIASFFNVNLLG